jgi:hypothetical protein
MKRCKTYHLKFPVLKLQAETKPYHIEVSEPWNTRIYKKKKKKFKKKYF